MGKQHRTAGRASVPRRQRGVVTIEYVFLLILGVLPMLLFTFTAVMVFAARQSLTLAAEEGARASLRHVIVAQGQNHLDMRASNACTAALSSMQWLLDFAQGTGAVSCEAEPLESTDCGLADTTCIRVVTRYDYDSKPFLPGTRSVYSWAFNQPITSTAIAYLDPGYR